MTAKTMDVITSPDRLHLHIPFDLSEEQFFLFCQANQDPRIERSAEGDITIMSPAGWETSAKNAVVTMQLAQWATRDGSGIVSDSSGGFTLPNGAVRAPDVAWVRRERLATLTAHQRSWFIPLCPDFVIELCSPTDGLSDPRAEMREYIDQEARLGWLIDPISGQVEVYRPDAAVTVLDTPAQVSGDPVLPGFRLDLTFLWQPAPEVDAAG